MFWSIRCLWYQAFNRERYYPYAGSGHRNNGSGFFFVESKNEPIQPLAWLRPTLNPMGKRVQLCTTMGASVDLVSEDLRRMIVNAAYFLTGQKFPSMQKSPMWIRSIHPFMGSFVRKNTGLPQICSPVIMDWEKPIRTRAQRISQVGAPGLSVKVI